MKTLTFSLGPPLSPSLPQQQQPSHARPIQPSAALPTLHGPAAVATWLPVSSHYLRHADQMPRQTKRPPEKSEATQASASMTRQTEFGNAKVDESHSFSLRRDEVPRGFLTRTGSRTIVLFACFVFFAFS